MGKTTGFKEFSRAVEPYRPAKERLLDFKEIYTDHDDEKLNIQAARCMDCGVPFCQSDEGCPVYNLIPEWNDLVYQDRWEEVFGKPKPVVKERKKTPSHGVTRVHVDRTKYNRKKVKIDETD